VSRFYEPVEEEVSNLRIERRRSRRRAWRDGLADQTVVNDFEDIRSSVPSSAASILDQ
jgi:hypothetical protein